MMGWGSKFPSSPHKIGFSGRIANVLGIRRKSSFSGNFLILNLIPDVKIKMDKNG
jgi:hypothetical protein